MVKQTLFGRKHPMANLTFNFLVMRVLVNAVRSLKSETFAAVWKVAHKSFLCRVVEHVNFQHGFIHKLLAANITDHFLVFIVDFPMRDLMFLGRFFIFRIFTAKFAN